MVRPSVSKMRRRGVVDGPVGSEGGRSPSMLSTDRDGMDGMMVETVGVGTLAPGRRWSVNRKHEVVMRLLGGESAEVLSRDLGRVDGLKKV